MIDIRPESIDKILTGQRKAWKLRHCKWDKKIIRYDNTHTKMHTPYAASPV